MAIATYPDLISAVAKFAWREGDGEFESSAEDFIALAESRLNRELPLRVMETDAALVGTVGSRDMALPALYVEPIALHLTTFGVSTPLKMSVAGEMPMKMSNGTPSAWCINGENIQLDTPCDQAHTFTFRFRKSFSLSPGTPTNWLLTNHPDVYLAAALVWGDVFMKDPEAAAPHKAILEEAIAEIGWKEARSRTGTLSVDPALAARGGFNIISG